jgi:hypothetical protein
MSRQWLKGEVNFVLVLSAADGQQNELIFINFCRGREARERERREGKNFFEFPTFLLLFGGQQNILINFYFYFIEREREKRERGEREFINYYFFDFIFGCWNISRKLWFPFG